MIRILRERLRQGYRTSSFPKTEPVLPDRFRGAPRLRPERCPTACQACVAACPFDAMVRQEGKLQIDLGRCLFCADCAAQAVCPTDGLDFSNDYRLAARRRHDLLMDEHGPRLATALDAKMLSLFGRSLKLRLVSAGGCNACEADINVLGTLVFDLARFGIQFVASPRHADGILVTGPVTVNMHQALLATYEAMPAPKLVIAAGACAINGGPFRTSPEARQGMEDILPVDLYIPGCPPHPYTALDGLLRLLDSR